MPDELDHARSAVNWLDPAFVAMVCTMTAAALGRTLMRAEPVMWRQFAGELLLGAVWMAVIWRYGAFQHLGPDRIFIAAACASLAGVWVMQWSLQFAVRLYQAVKSTLP